MNQQNYELEFLLWVKIHAVPNFWKSKDSWKMILSLKFVLYDSTNKIYGGIHCHIWQFMPPFLHILTALPLFFFFFAEFAKNLDLYGIKKVLAVFIPFMLKLRIKSTSI